MPLSGHAQDRFHALSISQALLSSRTGRMRFLVFPPFAVSSVRTSAAKNSMHTKTSWCERAKSSRTTDCFRFGAGETPERSLTWNEDPPATDFCGCINVRMSSRGFVDGLGGRLCRKQLYSLAHTADRTRYAKPLFARCYAIFWKREPSCVRRAHLAKRRDGCGRASRTGLAVRNQVWCTIRIVDYSTRPAST